MKIRKAVIAAAGFGTRFLPQTKAMPKEMLPLIDKPIIQYVVEELVDAGIEDIIIVTGYSKRSIEDHFDSPSADLIANLKMGGPSKEPLLREVELIADMANFVYVRQKGPYGNGTPLLNVEHLIQDEPFIYTWSDDFIEASPSRFKQLIQAYEEFHAPILAGIRAKSDADYGRYGFAGGKEVRPGVIDIDELVEKPGKSGAPSDLATVSGFVLTPDIFDYLHRALYGRPDGNELYYNDALKLMLKDGKKIIACEVKNGVYHDAGNKLEYLKTVVQFARKNTEIGKDFDDYLRSLYKDYTKK